MQNHTLITQSTLNKFFVFIFCIFSLTTHAAAQKNVLLILVDDLKPALGAYGDKSSVSPNIDKLANSGMRFDLAYANQAVCMASRYTLMLGSRSSSTGFYSFGTEFRDVYPNAVTMPQHFMKAGYHAESMGKVYHIGHGNTNDEASWSIPHHKEKVIEYVLPESTGGKLTREEAFFTNYKLHHAKEHKGKFDIFSLPRGAAWEAAPVTDDAYGDGRVATHAIDRLRVMKKRKQPFFMAVGFSRPHLPFSAPQKYWDMYDPEKLPMPEFEEAPKDTPRFAVKRKGEITNFFPIPNHDGPFQPDLTRKLIHGYYASVSYMDAQVGRVMDELKRLELDKNTIVVLWGDHGFHLGDHASWTKHSNFEQAIRIPLIFVAPGVTKPGTASNQPAESVDVFPTLASLTGLNKPKGPQPIDGLDLSPVLKNGKKRVRDHAYHAYNKRTHLGLAIRTERYRMVKWIPHDKSKETVYELYDYKNDPLETVNLAGKNKKVLNKLLAILDKHPEAKKQIKKRPKRS